MKFELKQHFRIESARFLPGLPESHPCSRMHGHSFRISLKMIGEQDAKIGWVIDYGEVSRRLAPILAQLDHRVLNEVAGLSNPTSENLAVWVFNNAKMVIPMLVQVGIAETPDTECLFPVEYF